MMTDLTSQERAAHQEADRAETRSTFYTAIGLAVVFAILWTVIVVLVPQRAAGAQEITTSTEGGSTYQTICEHYANGDDSPHVSYRPGQGYYLEWDTEEFCEPRSNWRITQIRTIERVQARRPYESTWHDWVGPTSWTQSYNGCNAGGCWISGAGGTWRIAGYPRAPMITRGKVTYIVKGFSTLYPDVTFTDRYTVHLSNGQAWNVGWHA